MRAFGPKAAKPAGKAAGGGPPAGPAYVEPKRPPTNFEAMISESGID